MISRAARRVAIALGTLVFGLARGSGAQTWTADNGNGTYTNPLFYDEFSDPDVIRVGDDFYLTGTTMHSMPGLPVLHSRDLVNWRFVSYASPRLDLGPELRLEDGKESYGRGIWAPSFRYHAGTFYIFSNVNGHRTQLFRARDPRGPWTRTEMARSFHDLSVLFDDDGKVYVIWGYQEIHLAQLDSTLTDVVPNTERIIIEKSAGMGEGSHFYKIDGKYFITSAWYAGRMRMPCARADRPEGPYEVNREISADESFGLREGHGLSGSAGAPPFTVTAPNVTGRGHRSLHQGGIVQTVSGDWWGFSMMDYNAVGRVTALSPVTWHDGWPYFGLAANLGRTPRTWIKPSTRAVVAPTAPYVRSDAFSSTRLADVWQWNHVPEDRRWSLTERRGFLRLHSLPATDLWSARNTLTQRAIGPRSTPTTIVETNGMQPGDVAGLALFDRPYAWIGVRRTTDGLVLEQYDQTNDRTVDSPIRATRLWLRADCDFLTEIATFSYSIDGRRFVPIGAPFTMVFQLKTFQGVRYSLFHYNVDGHAGGFADFDAMRVGEPAPRGIMRPIPVGRTIVLAQAADISGAHASLAYTVVDRGRGRVALRAGTSYASVRDSALVLRVGAPTDAETFQWIETPYGDLTLLSIATHTYLRIDSGGHLSATSRGPEPDPLDGTALRWTRRDAH